MKKLLTLAIIALAAMTVSAKGWYAGGSLGYWHESNSEETTNSFTILPDFGYSFDDTWTLGGQIGYKYNHQNGVGISSHIFSVNPFLRNTFWRSENGFVSLFCDLKAGLGLGWTHYKHGDDSDTACTWQVGLAPGISLNFTKHFSFVTHFGFLGYKGANNAAKAGKNSAEGGILLDSSTVTFGFYYNF